LNGSKWNKKSKKKIQGWPLFYIACSCKNKTWLQVPFCAFQTGTGTDYKNSLYHRYIDGTILKVNYVKLPMIFNGDPKWWILHWHLSKLNRKKTIKQTRALYTDTKTTQEITRQYALCFYNATYLYNSCQASHTYWSCLLQSLVSRNQGYWTVTGLHWSALAWLIYFDLNHVRFLPSLFGGLRIYTGFTETKPSSSTLWYLTRHSWLDIAALYLYIHVYFIAWLWIYILSQRQQWMGKG
jgi:hypothetical protein